MKELIKSMWRGSPELTFAGLAGFVFACTALVIMPFDERLILGVDPWLKPFKFTVSGMLYLLTLAWMIDCLQGKPKAVRVIAWVVVISMSADLALIWMQSYRGTTSHFNTSTPFDQMVYKYMGLFIWLSVFAAGWLLYLFYTKPSRLSPILLLGVKLGLITFLLGCMVGEALVLNGAHSVGVPDGGPGLPVVNWSLEAGDLRVAHWIGLHGLQFFPISAWFMQRLKIRQVWLITIFAVWLVVFLLAFYQALAGQPLISSERYSACPVSGILGRFDI